MSQTTERKSQLEGRIAELKDVEPLERLVQYAFRGGKASKSWTGEEHLVRGPRITIDGLHDILNGEEQVILLAELVEGGERKLVGCIHLKKEGDHGHIGMLAVDPDSQSTGAGKFLMNWSEEYAREHYRAKAIVGEVVSGRPELMAWYQRMGYNPTGETAPFNPEGVVHLVDGLHFIKIVKPLV
ncbi:MAG: GNAT family N-acetyltransferase [Candidatus Obscuribacterales bacterium]